MNAKRFKILISILIFGISLDGYGHEKKWPERRLRQVWPSAESFTSKQVSLSTAQIAQLEKDGVKIDSRQRSPTFYFAQSKQSSADKPLGVILFIDATGSIGAIEVSVAMGADGKVTKVDLWEQAENPQLNKPDFLNQFEGKSASDSFVADKDYKPVAGATKASAAVATATRDALKISNIIFRKK